MYVCVGEAFVYIGHCIFCMGDECAYVFFFYVILMLRGEPSYCVISRDRWPIQCLLANEVEGVSTIWGCCTLCLAILLALLFPMMFAWDLSFADDDIVMGGF